MAVADIRTQLFRTWFRLSRPMTLGARAIVENAAGEVLLVRQTYTKGLFFPGGGVESGETVFNSLKRELIEEAAVRVTGKASLIGVFSNHKHMRNDHVLLYHLKASAWESTGENPIGREISELVWAEPTSPPEDATPRTKRRLQDLVSNRDPDPYW